MESGPAASLDDFLVDDELLEIVLGHVASGAQGPGAFAWRHRLATLALVSRRWRSLLQKPQVRRALLAGIVLSLGDDQSRKWLGVVGPTCNGLPAVIPALEGVQVVDVAAGWQHALILDSAGRVYSCGSTSVKCVTGHGHVSSSHILPTQIEALQGIRALKVAAGIGHSLVLTEAPAGSPAKTQVYSFGLGQYGKLGHGDFADRPTPTLIRALSDKTVTQVAAAQFHSFVVTDQGEVYAFGSDDMGQLGLGLGLGYHPWVLALSNNTPRPGVVTIPQLVSALAGRHITAVSAGCSHSLFLSREGRVFSCGMDKYGTGRLGYKMTQEDNIQKLPRMIESLSEHRVIDISAGEGHSLVVTGNSQLFAFGSNANGQLGLGEADVLAHLPTLVPVEGELVVQAAASHQHSMVVTAQSNVYTFGLGSFYRLGLGDNEDRPKPTCITALAMFPVRRVAAAGRFSFVLA